METAPSSPANSIESMQERRRRRTVAIVDPRFQWKYTLIITAFGVAITAIMGGLLYRAHLANTLLLDLSGNAELQHQVMLGDQIFLLYIIALVVVMAVALTVWGLVVTNRISGPLYILGRYLDEIANGHYPDMRPLRRQDELHNFFASFEAAISTLRERDQAVVKAAEQAIEKARKALASGDAAAGLEEAMSALERQRDALSASLRDDS